MLEYSLIDTVVRHAIAHDASLVALASLRGASRVLRAERERVAARSEQILDRIRQLLLPQLLVLREHVRHAGDRAHFTRFDVPHVDAFKYERETSQRGEQELYTNTLCASKKSVLDNQ